MILWCGLKTGFPDKPLAHTPAFLKEPLPKVRGGPAGLCTTLWEAEEQEQSGKASWSGGRLRISSSYKNPVWT